MRNELICLRCEHTWYPRKLDEQLRLSWRQCPEGNCRSYDNLTLLEVQEMVGMVKEKERAGEYFLLLDSIEVVTKQVEKKGYRFRPLSTINLILMVWKEALRRK